VITTESADQEYNEYILPKPEQQQQLRLPEFHSHPMAPDGVTSPQNTGAEARAFWYAPSGGNLLAAGVCDLAQSIPSTGQLYAAPERLSGNRLAR